MAEQVLCKNEAILFDSDQFRFLVLGVELVETPVCEAQH